jgi:hypothetical protein
MTRRRNWAVLEWKKNKDRRIHEMAVPVEAGRDDAQAYLVIGKSYFGTKAEARIALQHLMVN